MRRDVVVNVVAELQVNPASVLAPLPSPLKVEHIVLKQRVKRRPSAVEYADIQALPHIMRVIVNMDAPSLLAPLKTVEVYTLFIVLADVVADHNVAVFLLHNPAEPVVIVRVIVLNERVDALVVGVEPAAIVSARTDITVSLVVLDFYSVCVEAENTVPGVVSA